MKRKRLGQAFLFEWKVILQTKQSHARTPRKRQSTSNFGNLNSTQDVKVILSLTRSSSTHYLCSEKANPRIEIPTTTHANSEKLLAVCKNYLEGRSLPIPDVSQRYWHFSRKATFSFSPLMESNFSIPKRQFSLHNAYAKAEP